VISLALILIYGNVYHMETSVFKSGNSCCVRLPKGYELPIGRVSIEKLEGAVVIRLAENGYPVGFWDSYRESGDKSWERIEQPEAEVKSW